MSHISPSWKVICNAEVATVLTIWKVLIIQQKVIKIRYEAVFVCCVLISLVAFFRTVLRTGVNMSAKIRTWLPCFKKISVRKSYDNLFCLIAALIFGWLLVLNDSSSQSTLLLPIMLLIWPSLSALHHVRAHPLVLAACWIVCMIFLFVSSSQFWSNVGEGIVMAVLSLMLLVGCCNSHALPRLSEERLNNSNESSNKSVSTVLPCNDAECTEQQQQILQQNVENAAERAQRYLIANVAHDMKSPLAALESGCDALKTSLERVSHFIAMHQKEQQHQEQLSLGVACGQDSHGCQALAEVRGMEETLKLIFGTCGMVQAMVNRYTDYTKAQLGVGLHAHLTSFALEEVVQSIAETFSLMQHRVKITVKTAAMMLASAEDKNDHNDVSRKVLMVRADRQWIFESILCLVSNAVKYCSNDAKEDAESVDRNYSSHCGDGDYGGVHSSGEVIIRCLCVANPYAVSVTNKNSAAAMMIRIEVEDNGCGVAADLRNELFTPMNMMKYTTGGTGLGLYILAQRVAVLGGQYGYSEAAGGNHLDTHLSENSSRGSIFWFTFPGVLPAPVTTKLKSLPSKLSALVQSHYAKQNEEKVEDQKSVPLRKSPVSLPQPIDSSSSVNNVTVSVPGPMTVQETKSPEEQKRFISPSQPRTLGDAPKQQFKFLLVDDAMPILRMTRRMLENEGHMVMDAVNGRDALHVLARDNGAAVDVVLMDIQMPIMDGIEATKQFRQLQREEQAAKTMQQQESLDDGYTYQSDMACSTRTAEGVTGSNSAGSSDSNNRTIPTTYPNNRALTVDLTSPSMEPCRQQQATSPQLHQQQKQHHHTIIIGCSANSDHITIEESMAAGMDAFIPKPVTMKKVYETLQQLNYCH